jgi:hypothetical protein
MGVWRNWQTGDSVMRVYENCKVYGPYSDNKDKRLRVAIVFNDGRKRTVSYPKYLMEKKLGRYLLDNETVDHKDGDFLNNDYDNLQILTRQKHCSKDAKKLVSQKFICPMCKSEFELSGKKLSNILRDRRRKKDAPKFGPFCNKSCAGKYSASIQYGYKKKPKVIRVLKTTYYR